MPTADDTQMLAALARQALAGAGVDDPAGRVARALLDGQPAPAGDDSSAPPAGRAVHGWLVRYLMLEAAARPQHPDLPAPQPRDLGETLWQTLVALRRAQVEEDPAALAAAHAAAEHALTPMPQAGPLHDQSADETLEAWTYTELTALHALDHLAFHARRDDWRERVAGAAAHHQQVTQPDYTTCEPWAVAAFLAEPATRPFAEQQLHDAAAQLRQRPEAGPMIGLILADAVQSLRRRSGR